MFGRRKAQPDVTSTTAGAANSAAGAKNRPTPKRKAAQAARRQPLVPDTRRPGGTANSKADRRAARAERAQRRQLMLAGDERYLAARDRGAARRAARDLVDSRWNIGEVLLPAMLLVLVVSLLASSVRLTYPALYTGALIATYGIFVFSGLDALLLARRVNREVSARFPADPQLRGIGRYAAMRAFQMRRSRIPHPQVSRKSARAAKS